MLVDTHAHLYWDSFREDFDEVIKRALDAGVSIIINVGVDVEKSKEAVQVSKKLALSGVEGYSTIGIHPHEALRFPLDKLGVTQGKLSEETEKLEEIYQSNPKKVVAVGECGLDYLGVDKQTKQLQRQLFQAQIDLAKKLNLPLIVHCRDDRSKNPKNTEAWDEIIEKTRDHFGIYHCYSGLPTITDYLLRTTNFLVSFAGNLTYPKNEYLRGAVKIIPIDRIVLETDCPFLPPQSKRGTRNEPANVGEIAQMIAQIKNISLDEVANQTTENVKSLLYNM